MSEVDHKTNYFLLFFNDETIRFPKKRTTRVEIMCQSHVNPHVHQQTKKHKVNWDLLAWREVQRTSSMIHGLSVCFSYETKKSVTICAIWDSIIYSLDNWRRLENFAQLLRWLDAFWLTWTYIIFFKVFLQLPTKFLDFVPLSLPILFFLMILITSRIVWTFTAFAIGRRSTGAGAWAWLCSRIFLTARQTLSIRLSQQPAFLCPPTWLVKDHDVIIVT